MSLLLGKTSLAVAASLVVNAGALTFLEWSLRDSQAAPEGEVTIVQLPQAETLLAQAYVPTSAVRQ
ncbi:MAG TPA: hypothetical protein VF161_06630 [Steroidobacteraceae bacterium]|jgi:hypothetical protein